jgi:riboflavin kinase/FMN adenylyltransferase
VALGNFDGVHLGHRQVIQPVLPTGETTEGHVYATVVTFHPHPQEFFTGQPRHLLTPADEKIAHLKSLGVEQLVLLPFDRELARLSPDQFVEEILMQKLRVKQVSVGQDFCFGRQRSGTATDLQAIAATYGIQVAIASLKLHDGSRISSSAIRHALQQGELELANRLLGRPYSLVGHVVAGQRLGRTLGFPTANLKLPPEKFLPKQGVYAVRVHVHEPSQDETALLTPPQRLGVMNFGVRPSVDGSHQTAEVHLLNWTGDLYGKTLVVSLEHFLRSEQKFACLDDLKAQIEADCLAARRLFAD